MIRVRIELCPLGDERPEAVKEIGRMYIANDGVRTREDRALGDYRVAVCRKGSTAVPSYGSILSGPRPARTGSVVDYPRLAYNVWRLIARAVLSAFPEEAKPRKRVDVVPVIDAAVMRGLRAMNRGSARYAGEDAEEAADMRIAAEWLDAAIDNYDDKETP